MSVLHIVNKSPYERNALDSCLRLSRQDSAILLIEDGIYAAQKNSSAAARLSEAAGERKVYVLQPDLDARGIHADQLLDGIATVDYDGFVELTTEYDKVQSWL
jgi:tRNA 2-thiouridine synthesizing protein B